MSDASISDYLQAIETFNESDTESCIETLTNVYRNLRNYCATGKHAQNLLANHNNLLSKTKSLLISLSASSNEKNNLCLLVTLQFIANYLVDNKINQKTIWVDCNTLLRELLKHPEPKIQNCIAMIIYNILLDNQDILDNLNENVSDVLRLTHNETSAEYAVFIIELFICRTKYIEVQYANLSLPDRLVLLSIVHSVALNPEGRKFPGGLVAFLTRYFVDKTRLLSSTEINNFNSLDAQEVSLLLEVINTIVGSDDSYLKEAQLYEDIFIQSISLLRTIHLLSKEKGNQFSMLLKIADLEAAERNADVQGHPGFGFKAGLVRLVGNLCCNNRGLQNIAREMDAIPLILDCCNIDARNPLIIQWAVLTMRNLCENNLENQKVVASVDRNGHLDTKRLADLGLSFNGAGKS